MLCVIGEVIVITSCPAPVCVKDCFVGSIVIVVVPVELDVILVKFVVFEVNVPENHAEPLIAKVESLVSLEMLESDRRPFPFTLIVEIFCDVPSRVIVVKFVLPDPDVVMLSVVISEFVSVKVKLDFCVVNPSVVFVVPC